MRQRAAQEETTDRDQFKVAILITRTINTFQSSFHFMKCSTGVLFLIHLSFQQPGKVEASIRFLMMLQWNYRVVNKFIQSVEGSQFLALEITTLYHTNDVMHKLRMTKSVEDTQLGTA